MKQINSLLKRNIFQAAVCSALTTLTLSSGSVAADGGTIDEVVITAEKRESTVQKTPIAIQAFTQEQIEHRHVVEIRDLNAVTPNAQIYPVQNSIQVAIRGIGSLFFDPRGDTATAMSIDGLYYARPVSNGGTFFDLARVEVLKGPQGTLYGRNAAAGAINLVANRPINEPEGMVGLDIGNYNEQNFSGMVNVPVTDSLYVRAAVRTTRRDGYINDYYNDNHTDAFRLSALYEATDKLSVYAAYNRSEFDGHGQAPHAYPCNGAKPYSAFVPEGCPGVGPGGAEMPNGGTSNLVLESAQINLDYDLGFATLSTVSGWVESSEDDTAVPLGTMFNADILTENETWSQEIRLAGNDDASFAGGLAWVIGAYYSDSDATYSEQKLGPPTIFTDLPATSYAFFGQGTYSLTDTLRATAGVRYTDDQKRTVDTLGNDVTFEDDNVSYRLGLEYDLAPDNLIYLTYSTGYVAGGANGGDVNLPTSPDRAAPIFPNEEMTSIEFGSKNRFLGNELQLNLAAYYYEFEHYQFFQPAFTNNVDAPSGAIQDMGDVDTYGVEFDVIYQPTLNDRFTFSGAWAEGEYSELQLAVFSGGPPNFVPGVYTIPEGAPLLNLPEFQFFAGYTRTFPLEGGAFIDASAYVHYSDEYSLVPGETDAFDVQKSYTMSDLSLSFTAVDDKYTIRAWIKNIEDEPVNVYGVAPNFHLYSVLPPRTFGISGQINF